MAHVSTDAFAWQQIAMLKAICTEQAIRDHPPFAIIILPGYVDPMLTAHLVFLELEKHESRITRHAALDVIAICLVEAHGFEHRESFQLGIHELLRGKEKTPWWSRWDSRIHGAFSKTPRTLGLETLAARNRSGTRVNRRMPDDISI